MSEKLTTFVLFVALCTIFLLNIMLTHEQKDNRANEKKIKEITTKLNAKTDELNKMSVELSMVKNDLEDANEVIGKLFEASLDLTDKYNELKKIKCKGKR